MMSGSLRLRTFPWLLWISPLGFFSWGHSLGVLGLENAFGVLPLEILTRKLSPGNHRLCFLRGDIRAGTVRLGTSLRSLRFGPLARRFRLDTFD